MRPIPWRLLAGAVATAVLLDLPFPIAGPLPVWRTIFAWFALVPLLFMLLRLPSTESANGEPARSKRWVLGWSFLAGWLCGALWFGANCYWVFDTMHLYGGMDSPLAALSLVLFSLYLGFWFGAFALALMLVRLATVNGRRPWIAFASIPFLWVSMEFALARIPEFPWDLLGYSQVDNSLLMRLAPWTGVYGISFVVAAVNALGVGARLWRRAAKGQRQPVLTPSEAGFLITLFIVVVSSGSNLKPPAPQSTATAVLVQPNLDVANDDVWVGPEWDRRMAQFTQFGRTTCTSYIAGLPDSGAVQKSGNCNGAMATPALIAWPESPAGFRDIDPKFRSAMASITTADKAPVIVGTWGIDLDTDRQPEIFNSASVFAIDGHVAGRYDKIHLVPFGEYVPLRSLLFFAHKLTQNLTDLSTGTERKTFRLASAADSALSSAHRYGIFICYESVFGDEIRHFALNGAEVLVNISDDGWYGDTSAPWQHLNMARMRAIENRRWILRDTNNGVTASIDPYGTIRQSIPRHEVGALAAQFAYATELTFYTRHGDWFAWICAIVGIGTTIWAIRALLRRKNLSTETSVTPGIIGLDPKLECLRAEKKKLESQIDEGITSLHPELARANQIVDRIQAIAESGGFLRPVLLSRVGASSTADALAALYLVTAETFINASLNNTSQNQALLHEYLRAAGSIATWIVTMFSEDGRDFAGEIDVSVRGCETVDSFVDFLKTIEPTAGDYWKKVYARIGR